MGWASRAVLSWRSSDAMLAQPIGAGAAQSVDQVAGAVQRAVDLIAEADRTLAAPVVPGNAGPRRRR